MKKILLLLLSLLLAFSIVFSLAACGEDDIDDAEETLEIEIESVEYNADGNLVITFKDGTTKVVAAPEKDENNTGNGGNTGNTGNTDNIQSIEIESIEYNADGNLVITFKDGTTKVVTAPEKEENNGGNTGNGGNGSNSGNGSNTGNGGNTGNTGNTGNIQSIEIESIEYDADGNLVIKYTNGETVTIEAPTKEEHQHTFGEWESYDGSESVYCEKKLSFRICSECNDVEWQKGSDADHVFDTVTTQPTCTEDGFDTKTCALCAKVVIDNTVSASHNFSTDYSFDSSYHWFGCNRCDAVDSKEEHTIDDTGVCAYCAQPTAPTEGIVYDISSDGTYAEVVAYNGTASNVLIADTYNGLPVKTICDRVFSSQNITSVIIPDSVTTIGSSAFYDCDSLTSVTIGDSVITIGRDAFYDCDSLTSVTIPDSVITIGSYAFAYCDSLTSVTIGDSVTTIGDSAFYYCRGLTSVTIGDSVTSIGSLAFFYCASALYTEYEYGKYIGDKNNPYAVLIGFTNGNLSTYTIHEDTKVIAYGVFGLFERLTSITIPDGVVGISDWAFYNCSSLTSVTIGDSVITIGRDAFYSCDSLTSVYITDIAAWCNIEFDGFDSNPLCNGANLYLNGELVTEVVIPDTVTEIKAYAFYSCDSLTSVVFANPNGWWCAKEADATSGTALSATNLSNTSTAATYLKSTYDDYYWHSS